MYRDTNRNIYAHTLIDRKHACTLYMLMYRQTDRIIHAHAQIILARLSVLPYRLMNIWPKLSYGFGLIWRHETNLSPPVNYFTDCSKAVLLLWIICVIYVLCLLCFRVCSFLPYGHLLGNDLPLGSRS